MSLVRHWALLLLTPLFLSACTAIVRSPGPAPTPAGQTPVAKMRVASPQDQLTATANDGRLVLDIESLTGVGEADVDLVAGEPAQAILLRFHLQGLEQLDFAYEDTLITVSLLSTGEHDVLEQVAGPGMAAPERIGPDSAYWMDVQVVSADPAAQATIPLTEGVIEVTAPADFLQGDHSSFSIAWLDFYR